MSGPWKVGVVGCGKIAGAADSPKPEGPVETHAQAYWRQGAFDLAAACQPNASSRGEFQKRWAIPRGYDSLTELLDRERLDVISLCSPSPLHAQQALEILQSPARPKLLFLEKPVCLSPEEGWRLQAAVRESGAAVLVNHTRRFDPAHQRLARYLSGSPLGKLVGGRCIYYGGWLNNGTHLVDTLRMLLPEEPAVLQASWTPGGRGEDENLNVLLTAGEAELFLEGWDEKEYTLFEMELRFEWGRVKALDFGSEIRVEKAGFNSTGERVLCPEPGPSGPGLNDPLLHAAHFIHAFLSGQGNLAQIGAGLDQALCTLEILWKAQQQSAAGSSR